MREVTFRKANGEEITVEVTEHGAIQLERLQVLNGKPEMMAALKDALTVIARYHDHGAFQVWAEANAQMAVSMGYPREQADAANKQIEQEIF